MTVNVDASRCIGCGMCAAAVPAVFQIQGRVSVVQAQPRTLAEEAGTPVVTAESGASWCSIQAEHARGSVLYTIRAVGESGTEEQVRTSLDRVLETWLSAPEGEKTSEIC